MEAVTELMREFDRVRKQLEKIRSYDPRFIDYSRNGMTNAQKIEAHDMNESIIIPTREFAELFVKRKEISMRLAGEIREKARSRLERDELAEELEDEDDENFDATYQVSGEDILGRRKYASCPYGFGGIIKRNELKDIVCEGPMNDNYCGKCRYNPEVPEDEDTKP